MNIRNLIQRTWSTGVLIFSLLAFKNKGKTIEVSTTKNDAEVDDLADKKTWTIDRWAIKNFD